MRSLSLYDIISSFLENIKKLGWEIYTCSDLNQIPCHATYIIRSPSNEKTCIYYREWKKRINPKTVEEDFYVMRELLDEGICDFILLIYSPGHNDPFIFMDIKRLKNIDKLIIFDIDVRYLYYTIKTFSSVHKGSIISKFKKHLQDSGFKEFPSLNIIT